MCVCACVCVCLCVCVCVCAMGKYSVAHWNHKHIYYTLLCTELWAPYLSVLEEEAEEVSNGDKLFQQGCGYLYREGSSLAVK